MMDLAEIRRRFDESKTWILSSGVPSSEDFERLLKIAEAVDRRQVQIDRKCGLSHGENCICAEACSIIEAENENLGRLIHGSR